MKINSTDWVLYRINPLKKQTFLRGRVEIKFEEFSKTPTYIANRLQQLSNRYVYTEIISHSEKWGDLDLLLVADKNASKYAENFKTSFKASNSPYYGFKGIFDHTFHLGVSDSIMSLYDALNSPIYDSGTKKAISTDIIKRLSERNLTFKEVMVKWNKLYEETKEKINQLKKFMKEDQKKQFLAELWEYNEETKKVVANREYILIYNVPSDLEISSHELNSILLNNYVTYLYPYEVVHDILTIKSKKYKIVNGNFECTEELYNALSQNSTKDPIIDINWESDIEVVKLTTTDPIATSTAIKINTCDIKKFIGYLNVKFPNKNYSIFKEEKKPDKPGPKVKKQSQEKYRELYKERMSSKKDVTQRPWQKRLEGLPKPGMSAPVEPRKVCCMEIQTGKIFRGLNTRVEKLVNSGAYEYCQKKFWKQIIYYFDIEANEVKFIGPARYNAKLKKYELPITTNISKSPKDRRLGERREKRELAKEKQNAFFSYNQNGRRMILKKQKIVIPGENSSAKRYGLDRYGKYEYSYKYTEKPSIKTIFHVDNFKPPILDESNRIQQSAKDLKEYIDSLNKPKSNGRIRKNKNPKRLGLALSWEAVLTVGKSDTISKDTILDVLQIKAFHKKEAEDKLNRIIKSKSDKEGKVKVFNYGEYYVCHGELVGRFTGKTTPWITKTGNLRSKENILKKKYYSKPKKVRKITKSLKELKKDSDI